MFCNFDFNFRNFAAKFLFSKSQQILGMTITRSSQGGQAPIRRLRAPFYEDPYHQYLVEFVRFGERDLVGICKFNKIFTENQSVVYVPTRKSCFMPLDAFTLLVRTLPMFESKLQSQAALGGVQEGRFKDIFSHFSFNLNLLHAHR